MGVGVDPARSRPARPPATCPSGRGSGTKAGWSDNASVKFCVEVAGSKRWVKSSVRRISASARPSGSASSMARWVGCRPDGPRTNSSSSNSARSRASAALHCRLGAAGALAGARDYCAPPSARRTRPAGSDRRHTNPLAMMMPHTDYQFQRCGVGSYLHVIRKEIEHGANQRYASKRHPE